MKKVKNIIIMSIVIICTTACLFYTNATDEDTSEIQTESYVLYSSHLRNLGWEEDFSKKDGETSGTTGQNRAVEAIKIKLNNMPEGVTVKYQVHVKNIGWMDWVNEGEVAGTTGKALNIEAIRVELENTDDYSIEYRTHSQDIGWQEGWSIDGEIAGTTGKNKKVEAIEIRIIPKTVKGKIEIESMTDPIYESTLSVQGWAMANAEDKVLETYIDGEKVESKINYSQRNDLVSKVIGYGGIENTAKPGFNIEMDISDISDGKHTLQLKLVDESSNEITSIEKEITVDKNTIRLKYQAHVKNVGWMDWVYGDDIAGTTGKNLQIEAIKIELIGNLPEGANIKYQVHVKNVGWMDWVNEGETAGTTGQNKRIEAIRIKLENLDDYSIEYVAHVQNVGWQNWAIDGEMAGTSGKKLQVEALQINIIPKTIRAVVNIDTNLDSTIDEKNFTISGWAMSNTENTTLNAYIDGEKIDSTVTYYERDDIDEIGYGGIENTPEPGFDMDLDITNISDGNHTLELRLVDETGTEIASTSKNITIDKTTVGVKYQTHVSNIGWMDWVKGSTQSNSGGSKVEAMNVKLVGDLPEDAEITYQVHVQDIGWIDWVSNGEMAGTTGQNKKIEAFRIKLNNVDDKYSIEYNAFVEGIGWQGWAYDGEISGTTGQNKKIESIRIRIVDKITETRAKMYVDTPVMDGVSVVTVTQKSTTISGWAMTNVDGAHIRIEVDGKGAGSAVTRVARQDVLDKIKGYGGEEKNPLPGFTATINFAEYSIGTHTISVKVLSADNELLCSIDRTLNVEQDFVFETGTYGYSGLGVISHPQGTALPYYKIGKGPNVLFATFAIHGWEDGFAGDGSVLIQIAEDFKDLLVQNKPSDINENWTIYIFPGVNRDGVYLGTSHNGPGRTTLYSMAPNNKGIDINRCWQTSSTFKRYTSDRNYNGTVPFQAYEANYLRQFFVDHKSTSGKTVVVDLHGWLNETIGDNGLGQYYRSQFGMSTHISSYGEGYLINWARQNLGANGVAARSTLVELPQVSSTAEAMSRGYSTKYYNATLNMLRAVQ